MKARPEKLDKIAEAPVHDETGWPSDKEWTEMLETLRHFYGKYDDSVPSE